MSKYKLINYSFGIFFILFNLGSIICYYNDLGFDLMLIGGIGAVIALIFFAVEINLKDLIGTLLYLTLAADILDSVFYAWNWPNAKMVGVIRLLLLGLLLLKSMIKFGVPTFFRVLLTHPFLNHPLVKATIAIHLVRAMFKIMHWDHVEVVDQLINLSLIGWALSKFVLQGGMKRMQYEK